jgi:hypothetical protein
MLFRSGAGYYICSGSLIADKDSSNSLPLFLTANHCVSKSREASSLENFFQFAAISCNDTSLCEASYDSLRNEFNRTLGASIVSTGRGADYTLLRLSENVPAGTVSLGWNATPVAFNSGVDLFRISHPGGSPVVNSAGEIVGQLSGACGTNLNDTCDAQNNATVDGGFAAYFGAVEQCLDPDGGPVCTPTETPDELSCNDGQDNDCDGDTDAADPDCATGGLPSGSACQVNSECASNNCKGKPGAKTCK